MIGPESYEAMAEILEEIQSGKFAREWMLENMVNRPMFNALTKADEEHLIEEVGKESPGHDAPVQALDTPPPLFSLV